jgi:two-component system phosphate regulon sensor histidine kinase PhoR
MVHEFRAPLGAVKGLLEVAEDRSLGDALDPYLPLLERAEARLDGLVELIGDLLSLSRIESELRSPAPAEPLAVPPVVEEVVGLHRERAAGRSVTVDLALPPDLPPLRIGADDLRTLLGNLVGNAIKYSKEGGGRVRVRAVVRPGWVRLDVADEGIGIREASLPRLFEVFFREKRQETRDIEGNGLGLAIVKRLVDRAGGHIEVQSREGEGTTFRVFLPA